MQKAFQCVFYSWQIVFCWCCLLFAPMDAQAQGNELVIGPYVPEVTAEKVVVAFELARANKASVVVFAEDGERRFESDSTGKMHHVTLHGLTLGRSYEYVVVPGDGEPLPNSRARIQTPCLAGESFSFAVYGDTRPGQTGTSLHHRNVVQQVLLNEPSFSLILGDLVNDGTRHELWQRFFNVEGDLLQRSAVFPVLGDNDYAEGSGLFARFFPRLEKGYFNFEWGGVQFFGLNAWDTRGRQPRSEVDGESSQFRWLSQQLKRPEVQNAPFRIVFLHDPVFVGRGRASALLQRVWAPLFEEGGVDLVFASWHLYERSHHNGVQYVISGGGGAELIWMPRSGNISPVAEARRYHFCRVDVNANSLNLRAIAEDGTVLDDVVLTPDSGQGLRSERFARLAGRLAEHRKFRFGETDGPSLPLDLFSTDCSFCRRLIQQLLPTWAETHGVNLDVRIYDLAKSGVYDLLLAAGLDFGRQNLGVPAVFAGSKAMGGQAEIQRQLPQLLAAFSKAPERVLAQRIIPFADVRDTAGIREQQFRALSPWLVVSAGVLDGINPCAFTVVLFLVSYLSLAKRQKRRILVSGASFTAGVFFCYLLIGIFFFQCSRWLMKNPVFDVIIPGVLALTVFLLAALSLLDAWQSARKGTDKMVLRIPVSLQKRMRSHIRAFANNTSALGAAAFALGVVIASMELACTGQVYLPIVSMIASPEQRSSAMVLLLLYNGAFVLPLVVVFLVAVAGGSSKKLAAFYGHHLPIVKAGMAVLFLVMGVMLVHNLGWI